jgi:hypothetical protein
MGAIAVLASRLCGLGFDPRPWCHTRVEFVGSLPFFKGFSPSAKTNPKFQFNLGMHVHLQTSQALKCYVGKRKIYFFI